MLKIDKKLSVILSLILTFVCFAGLIYMYFYMPTFTDYLLSLPDYSGKRLDLSNGAQTAILVSHYFLLVLATVAVVLIFFLLRQVIKKVIFSQNTVALIRCISWCVLLAGAILAIEGFLCFEIFIFVGGVIFFMGIAIRVLKNVFEEAVAIKEENDYTV